MLRHIVLFKIKEECKDQIPALIDGFYGMMGKVPGLIELEAGQDILGSERSYDLALVTGFTDRDAFDAYQNHPAHMVVKKNIHAARESSVACDFIVKE